MARKQTATKENPAAEAMPAADTVALEPLPPAARTAGEPPVEVEERRPWPDVMEQKTLQVSPDGDKLRLLQSRRYNQLQISHDGEIPDWARERLKADGWRDRVEDEGIYTKQLPPRAQPGEEDPARSSSRRRTGFEADRFLEQLANDIRAERKMPPVRLNSAAVAER